jgi:hypothetical protein
MLGISSELVQCILNDNLNMCWFATKFYSTAQWAAKGEWCLHMPGPLRKALQRPKVHFEQSEVMRYGFIGVTQKPSNSSFSGTAPSSSHPKNLRQYTIQHVQSVTHSVHVGWCIDCKNMQGMNKTKNARKGCSNVNSMLMLLPGIHGMYVLWISSTKTNCEPLLLNILNSGIGFSITKSYQPYCYSCMWISGLKKSFHTLPDQQI